MEKTWLDDPRLLHKAVTQIETQHRARTNLDKVLLRLYYQRPVIGTRDPMRPYAELSTFETLQQLGFNITREVIDASMAQICRPLHAKVQSLSNDFETRRAIELIGRLVDGVIENSNFLDVATEAYRDGSTVSVGPVKWFIDPQTQEIKCERVDPLSVYWLYDEGENPAHLYTVTPVPRVVLKARYPGMAGKFDDMPTYRVPTIVGVEPPSIRGADTVRVDEGWRRSIAGEKGRHVIAAGDVVLEDEVWKYDFHPIVNYRWAPDFRGYGGTPLARVIAPYHIWSNQLVRNVFESSRGAVPWLLAHEDSLVQQVSDQPFQYVPWTGPVAPTVVVNNPISPQILQLITTLRERAFAEGGVNAQAAAGSRPSGLNSAPAQREWIDIVSIRSQTQQRAWEKMWRESARIIVALAADAYKSKALRTRAPGTDLLNEIKWEQFKDIKEEEYRITFALASGLSLTVSGRLEQIQTLKDAGLIDTAEAARYLQLPDTQQLSDRINAPRDLADQQVSAALNDGKFIMPSALQDLAAIITMGTQEYQRAMLSGKFPEENMELLRRLILAAKARQVPPAPPPVAAPPPGLPPGPPGALPPAPPGPLSPAPLPPPPAPAPPVA